VGGARHKSPQDTSSWWVAIRREFGRQQKFMLKSTGGELGHELRCYDDALSFVAEARDRAALVERIDAMFPRGT
jgi:hypothetical protein